MSKPVFEAKMMSDDIVRRRLESRLVSHANKAGQPKTYAVPIPFHGREGTTEGSSLEAMLGKIRLVAQKRPVFAHGLRHGILVEISLPTPSKLRHVCRGSLRSHY